MESTIPLYEDIYEKFRDFTMLPKHVYLSNLKLVDSHKDLPGCVVECGTWKGGMSGGIASVLGKERNYFLFDSFEGLPEAKAIDGEDAKRWQQKKDSPTYYDNCRADQHFAEEAMALSGATVYQITKGWVNETLPGAKFDEPIAILRLDVDWYGPTLECLEYLYDKVMIGGIIILDDYYVWDGCNRAVHDFLSKRKLSDRIFQYDNMVAYIVKEGKTFEPH